MRVRLEGDGDGDGEDEAEGDDEDGAEGDGDGEVDSELQRLILEGLSLLPELDSVSQGSILGSSAPVWAPGGDGKPQNRKNGTSRNKSDDSSALVFKSRLLTRKNGVSRKKNDDSSALVFKSRVLARKNELSHNKSDDSYALVFQSKLLARKNAVSMTKRDDSFSPNVILDLQSGPGSTTATPFSSSGTDFPANPSKTI